MIISFNFKGTVYESFSKHGSLVEIEKLVKMYEEKTSKRMNFMQKSGGIGFGSKTKYDSKAMLSRSKVTLQTINKDKEKVVEKEKEVNARNEKLNKACLAKNTKTKPKGNKTKDLKNINNSMYALEEGNEDDYEESESEMPEEESEEDDLFMNNSFEKNEIVIKLI